MISFRPILLYSEKQSFRTLCISAKVASSIIFLYDRLVQRNIPSSLTACCSEDMRDKATCDPQTESRVTAVGSSVMVANFITTGGISYAALLTSTLLQCNAQLGQRQQSVVTRKSACPRCKLRDYLLLVTLFYPPQKLLCIT